MGLREFAEAKDEDGQWVYPQVRADLKVIKDRSAAALFYVEQKIALAEADNDSLKVELMVAKATQNTKWYKSSEVGFISGAVVTLLVGWSVGQVWR